MYFAVYVCLLSVCQRCSLGVFKTKSVFISIGVSLLSARTSVYLSECKSGYLQVREQSL